MLGRSLKPPSLPPQLTHPLETVCISLLDLVVALTKFLLVFIFSLEETPIRASFLSRQPSLRAFTRCLFIISCLGRSQPYCPLVGSENPFLTSVLDDIQVRAWKLGSGNLGSWEEVMLWSWMSSEVETGHRS